MAAWGIRILSSNSLVYFVIIIRGAYLLLVPQGRGLIRNGRLAWGQGAYFFLRDGKMRNKALMLISLRIKKT